MHIMLNSSNFRSDSMLGDFYEIIFRSEAKQNTAEKNTFISEQCALCICLEEEIAGSKVWTQILIIIIKVLFIQFILLSQRVNESTNAQSHFALHNNNNNNNWSINFADKWLTHSELKQL